MSAIKALLCVRTSTPNVLCLAELGLPPLHALVKRRQSHFFKKLTSERIHLTDDPFMFAIELTRSGNQKMMRYVDNMLCSPTDSFVSSAVGEMRNEIMTSTKTKSVTYCGMNPMLAIHDVYDGAALIPEQYRI